MTYFLIGDSITLTLLIVLIFIFAYYVWVIYDSFISSKWKFNDLNFSYNLRTNNIFRRLGMPGPAPIPILVFSHRLARHLSETGYSMVPRDTMNYFTQLFNQILARRRQYLERRNDFIQMMIDHEEEVKHEEQVEKQERQSEIVKKTLNDKEILGQALVFLVAGYETTSVLISFFFYVMATEPVIQEKVYNEIRQELGDDEVTYEKLSQLQYLDMVINETLRMYPPFTRFERVASNNYQLGNYDIPKGTIISVPVYPIHHDPNIWPEPEKFIPERFLPTEKAKRHPMTYLPFGDGPRNCIGMRFALLEAKLAIVKALRLVEIQKCDKTEVRNDHFTIDYVIIS
ncbi:unnamed protein product [Rotaria sp. Silwood1]|nr:unnamed protein product [Rotaria sp. Silwood1]